MMSKQEKLVAYLMFSTVKSPQNSTFAMDYEMRHEYMKSSVLLSALALLCVGLASCDLFYVPPTVSITTDKDEYGYGETIAVKVTETHDQSKNLTYSFKIDGETPDFNIADYTDFSFTLTPDTTKTYVIEITASDGTSSVQQSKDIVVQQMPFIGTWKASAVTSPAYPSTTKDVEIIWRINGFELYYYDLGGNDPLTYSGKGTIEFPTEGAWFSIDQQEYYTAAQVWDTWTLTDGVMKVKYSFVDDKLHIELFVDSNNDGTSNYTWNLVKESDSTTSLH